MRQFRIGSIPLSTVLICLACQVGLCAETPDSVPAVAIPDISGEWAADLPFGSLIVADSDQPVNSFRIFKSQEANFKVRYLGRRASRTPLHWVEKTRQFEGTTQASGAKAKFVVIPTDDPDVLTCRIEVAASAQSKEILHKDTWKRIRNPSPDSETATVLRYEDPDLSIAATNDIEDLLTNYVEYLKKAGFELKRGQVQCRVQTEMGNAHYYHSNRLIVVDPRVVGDKSVIRREYNHHALATALGDDSKEIFDSCAGIESGLADYFGCSSCDDPNVGIVFAKALGYPDGPLRTMDNQRGFASLPQNSGRHDVGEVISGTLWEMRTAIGKDTLDPLLYKAWIGLPKTDEATGQVRRFATSLLECTQSENPETAKKLRSIFEDRGLNVPKSD